MSSDRILPRSCFLVSAVRCGRRGLVTYLAALMATGCGGYNPEAHRVDHVGARLTLDEVLSSWQRGESPEAWRQKEPEVVIQDRDWSSGLILKAYEIVGDGEAIDANLHCQVKLTLEDPQQGEIHRTVGYIVSTSPACTVFRALGP